MNADDLYKILGVRPTASPEAIKRAYHRLARTSHPDVNSAPDAEERMKALNRAYEILSDPERRRQYDRDHKILEPVPVRRETKETSARPPGDFSPGPQQPTPGPAQPRPKPHWMAWAAGLCGILLMLVFMGAGTSVETSDLPVVTPAITPVITATPLPPAPVQKTFDSWKTEGDTFMAQHRNGDALAAYDQALAIRPNASELLVIEGDIYEQMGDFTNAIACYDRATTIDPGLGAQVQKKSTVLKEMNALMKQAEEFTGQGDYPAAIVIYDDILASGIRNTDLTKRILSGKMYALLKAGRSDEAASVSRAIELL